MIGSLELFLYAAMVLMATVMAYIVYLSRNAANPVKKLLVYLLLAMMNGMLIGPLIYLLFPGLMSVDAAFEISAVAMSAEMIPFLVKFVSNILGDKNSEETGMLQFFVIFFVLVDEILMSIEFNILSNPSFMTNASTNIFRMVSESISNYWFIFPMSLEMVLTVAFLQKKISRIGLTVMAFQAAIMFLSPTAVNSFHWGQITVYVSAAVMTGLLIIIFEYLYRKNSVSKYLGNYLLLLLLAYAIMMAGVFFWQYAGTVYVFASGTILNMVLFLHLAMNPERTTEGKKLFWLADRKWSFYLLLLVFVAEFFMGGVLDNQYFGAVTYVNSLGIISINGPFYVIISKSIYDFIMGFSSISLSPFFYIMMGFEMGALIVFKALKTRSRETIVRLGLMMVAYALYTTYLPTFFYTDPAKLPFLGWSMGIGTVGPFSPLYLVPIFLSYVITAVLSLLFGARNLCSVFCPAPAMYQGTFYNSMKKFNKSGTVAKSLTSANKLGGVIYRSVSLTVYVAIGTAAVLSYLTSIGTISLSIYGTDPTVFIYLLLFGPAWYIVFILMPFVGSYGCINTGYCSWGNFNRFFTKLGFFRLKVKSVNQCLTCSTKDCVSACPVGNYGQAGSFIEKGEFVNSRCVGVGDCVEACPYDNIFFYDVRHWIRGRAARKNQTSDSSRRDGLESTRSK